MELARSILGVGGQHDGYSKGAPIGKSKMFSEHNVNTRPLPYFYLIAAVV